MATVLDPLLADPVEPSAPGVVVSPTDRLRSWDRWPSLVTALIVAGSVLYTLVHLSPDMVVAATTPAGGDFGAHVWGPAYLRDHILPHWRLSGWAPDWYAGFPMYQYYMVVPALMVVALDVVLPYGVAMKIVSLLGIATLPICAWALGRLGGLPFPAPAIMAVAATMYLFDQTFTIYGGNIASTMAGEFSFSIALSFSVLFFAVLAKGFETGRYRAWAATLFALACLCHGIVAIFTVIGTAVMFLLWADRHRLKYLLTFGPVGAALTAFWMLPFLAQRQYLTDMGYEKRTDYMKMLFPFGLSANLAIGAAALLGLVVCVLKGRRTGVFLGVMMILYAAWSVVQPQSQLWNARLLPFLYLCRYLLAAIGVGYALLWAARFVSRARGTDGRFALWFSPVPVALAAVVMLGLGLRDLPFGTVKVVTVNTKTEWVYHWGPFHSSTSTFVGDWARWNYKGYENKDAYGEYYGVISTMKVVGQQRGCGRAVWENNNVEDRYGTPMALMLLPFWTNGCIASMEGLFFESSATTPYHFLTTSALSDHSSNPVRRLHYQDADVPTGVREAQALGVRYYLAFSPHVVAQADKDPDLTKVANSGPWHVYEIASHDLVTPLTTQPVVVTGSGSSRDRWLELATSWFQHPDQWAGLPAQSGPPEWQRITVKQTSAQKTDSRNLAVVEPVGIDPKPLAAVTVSNVTTGDDRVSFDVDRPGVPVLVKVSYFPNWTVSGAKGPWRVAPNLMVVIPTGTHVSLHYGRSSADLAGMAITALGLVGLVLLRKRNLVFPTRVRPGAAGLAGTGLPLPAPVGAPAEAIWWLDWEDPAPPGPGPSASPDDGATTWSARDLPPPSPNGSGGAHPDG